MTRLFSLVEYCAEITPVLICEQPNCKLLYTVHNMQQLNYNEMTYAQKRLILHQNSKPKYKCKKMWKSTKILHGK